MNITYAGVASAIVVAVVAADQYVETDDKNLRGWLRWLHRRGATVRAFVRGMFITLLWWASYGATAEVMAQLNRGLVGWVAVFVSVGLGLSLGRWLTRTDAEVVGGVR